jgi:hypothetical protein
MPKVRSRSPRMSPVRAASGTSYVDRAKLHAEVVEGGAFDGCWTWLGHISGGVPRLSRRPGDGRGPINARVAVLAETSGRPEWAHTATATCGNDECVNPAHLAWESRADFHSRIAKPRVKVSDERVRQAWQDRRAGIPVKEIAARLNVSRSALYERWHALRLPEDDHAAL